MKPRRWAPAALWAALGLTLGLGCELAVTLDHLDNGMCGANEKLCGDNKCHPFSDPDHGCGNQSCNPCILEHALATCDAAFNCVVRACVGTWVDCDHMPGNGCETDTTHDPNFCGSCSQTTCGFDHSVPACLAGICAIGGCDPGWANCDDTDGSGCETSIWSNARCGRDCSAQACPAGRTCNQGTCM